MIFVDTGAWFASVVPADRDHATATRWLSQNTQPLLTTDYIIDETLTLLKARGQTLRAMPWARNAFVAHWPPHITYSRRRMLLVQVLSGI